MRERGWWIDPDRFLGHPNPTSSELEKFYHAGFRVIITLVEDDSDLNYDAEEAERSGYRVCRIPIVDFHPPCIADFFELNRIMDSCPPGQQVLMHCEASHGRTGTMAAAYWVFIGMSADAAIELVRSVNPLAIETVQQAESIYALMEELRND